MCVCVSFCLCLEKMSQRCHAGHQAESQTVTVTTCQVQSGCRWLSLFPKSFTGVFLSFFLGVWIPNSITGLKRVMSTVLLSRSRWLGYNIIVGPDSSSIRLRGSNPGGQVFKPQEKKKDTCERLGKIDTNDTLIELLWRSGIRAILILHIWLLWRSGIRAIVIPHHA